MTTSEDTSSWAVLLRKPPLIDVYFRGSYVKRTASKNGSLETVLFTKLSLKVIYFQRRFIKRTIPTNALIEVVLFSQPPLKMAPPNYPFFLLRTVCMLSTIISLGGQEMAKIEWGGFAL